MILYSIKNIVISAVILIVVITGCGEPANEEIVPVDPVLTAKIDSLLLAEIDQGNIPGAAVLIQRNDTVLYRNAHGYAHLFDRNLKRLPGPEAMTPDHLFDLASLTKVLATTFGIMLLTDRGMVDLDDPVHQYLQEFEQGDKRKITVRHLLNHSSGLEQWYPFYYHASSSEERYRVIAGRSLKFPVGESRRYSDAGFMVLGDLIKKVSGRPLDQFLNEELYQPLGLKKTVFNPLEKGFSKIAATSHGNPFEKRMVYDDDFGYNVDVDPESWDGWRDYTLKGEVNDGNAWHANNGVAGHAGLFSTLDETGVLVELLLNKGKHDGQTLIPEEVIDEFLRIDKFGNGLGWAMDPQIFSAAGAPDGTFGHTGFTGTSVVFIPRERLSVILLTNRQNVGTGQDGFYFDLGELREAVFQTVYKTIN